MEILCSKMEVLHSENGKFPNAMGSLLFCDFFHAKSGNFELPRSSRNSALNLELRKPGGTDKGGFI